MYYTILIGIFVCLFSIIVQDFKNRNIDVFTLMIFIGLSFGFSVFQNNFLNALQLALFPILFIVFQLLVLKMVYYFKEKKATQIIDTKLGLGDIVFWIALAFQFSLFNYILFFVLSMLFVLGISLLKKYKSIPLAGGQALFLAFYLILNQFVLKFNNYDDLYLLNLLF